MFLELDWNSVKNIQVNPFLLSIAFRRLSTIIIKAIYIKALLVPALSLI